jgi:cold shock CspA family protein
MMPTGTVKFYDGLRGFGFIKQDGDGQNIFVHERVVEKAGLLDHMTPGRNRNDHIRGTMMTIAQIACGAR